MDTSKQVAKASPKREALGKGLGSLLGLDREEVSASDANAAAHDPALLQQNILEIAIDKIQPNPKQPRKIFKDSDLLGLAQSLKQDGVIQPLLGNTQITVNTVYTFLPQH